MKNNKLLNLYKKYVPEYSRLMLPLALVWNLLAYYGGKLLGGLSQAVDISSPRDALIPFIPATVIFYVLGYVFWVVNYTLAARRDREFAARFFYADFLTRLACFVVFAIFPTTYTRPELTGGGLWIWMLSVIYACDSPTNLFPSIHCIASLLSYAAVAGNKKIPLFYRIFSLFFAAAVSISAVTTKQHVHTDIIAGTAFMLVCWLTAKAPYIAEMYMKVISKLQSKMEFLSGDPEDRE